MIVERPKELAILCRAVIEKLEGSPSRISTIGEKVELRRVRPCVDVGAPACPNPRDETVVETAVRGRDAQRSAAREAERRPCANRQPPALRLLVHPKDAEGRQEEKEGHEGDRGENLSGLPAPTPGDSECSKEHERRHVVEVRGARPGELDQRRERKGCEQSERS